MKAATRIAILAALVLSATAAFASDVPPSLIVTRAGLEFAWASPCAPQAPSCGGTLVMHDGWHLTTAAEFLAGFTDPFDLDSAFNDGAKCASAYFNSGYSHCDGVNVTGNGGYERTIWNAPASWGAVQDDISETFVSRQATPEPTSLVLLGTGLVALFVGRKRLA